MSGGTGFQSNSSIGDLDLQIGAVEIKNSTTDDRANVVLRADGKYALAVDASLSIPGYIDDSAFVVGVDRVLPVGYIATSDSINAGDVGAARITLDRRQLMILDDGTQELDLTTIHSAYGATLVAMPISGKYEVTPTIYNTGDAVPLTFTSDGKLRTDTTITKNVFEPINSYFTYGAGNRVTKIVEVDVSGSSLVSSISYSGNDVTQILQAVYP